MNIYTYIYYSWILKLYRLKESFTVKDSTFQFHWANMDICRWDIDIDDIDLGFP